jgi:hypothetical protein
MVARASGADTLRTRGSDEYRRDRTSWQGQSEGGKRNGGRNVPTFAAISRSCGLIAAYDNRHAWL